MFDVVDNQHCSFVENFFDNRAGILLIFLTFAEIYQDKKIE